MKIEKVNEHQIRCTLTREDLATRELKISELAYGTEKAKTLFRDMMRQAAYECGFEAEDIPLMIEAIPLNSECIVLIITKVEDPEELDTRFSKFSPSLHEEAEAYDEDADDLLDAFSDGADEVLNMLRKMNDNEQTQDNDSSHSSAANPGKQADGKQPSVQQISCQLFTFTSLNNVTRLAHVVSSSYQGVSSLYKNDAAGTYLLLISPDGQSASDFNRTCNLISEYGRPEKAVNSAKAYLEEHFEPLIKDHALTALAQI